MAEPTVVLEKQTFLEGLRWRAGRVWVSDFYTHRHLSLAEDGSDLRVEATVPAQPSGTGVLPDGRLLIASMRDRRILRREPDGTLAVHADLSGLARGVLNDMTVDPQGRCWVGCFGFDFMNGEALAPAVLIRVDPDGSAEIVADDVLFPNGAVCDGRTLVVAESFGNRMTAFDVQADGSLANRREWARFGEPPTSTDLGEVLPGLDVVPDGIAEPDAEGAIWVADADHHRAIRVREGGEILGEVSVGDLEAYAVALGGEDGRTLFLATAPSSLEHERAHTRDAVLLAARVEVPLGL
ncbi:SMP-30/gluconolactonase/LRE family protein [Pseudonocardia pini]|uniref:SMP-30/gluconolactonase/LRE family protein n=1 Tax=Pseudonocardia pini TaxID=2758030 RepID=UPI0015F088EF|nr:SMP-30/gluconolactonase/LRE family protein [Pseudonocardia pini]